MSTAFQSFAPAYWVMPHQTQLNNTPAIIHRRTVIVTGAGTGIGQATARFLIQKGWRAFATLRHPNPDRDGPDALALDVTDDDSIDATVAEVMRRAGRIDAIVNNAAVDLVGAAEETSIAEAQRLFQTNFFGVHRLNQKVLPIMRQQGRGYIVTIGSIAGFLPTPFDAFYSASKHALRGYTETLAFETAPLGIRCVLIEPGFIKTELRTKKTEVSERISVYEEGRAKAERAFDTGVSSGISPERVAAMIARALDADRPKLRQRVGNDAHMLAFIRHFMPEPLFQMGLKRRF
jgi:NAD(P)-dependent dehydrogenase (short-subunit alcohol dehydrogenase family)